MHFSNFWAAFDYEEAQRGASASIRFLFGALNNTDFHVGSVFGHCPTPFDLLFSGECVKSLQHDGEYFAFNDNHTDKEGKSKWFMGIPRIDHPRALWLPLFYCYWADYRNSNCRREIAPSRKEFGISVVIGNLDNGSLTRRRAALAHNLSLFFPVHANAALRQGAPAGSRLIYHDVPDKLAFVAQFTHHLCFENTSQAGYITEKLFDPIYVGTVPLYAGDPLAGEWFYKESFIDCAGLDELEIVERISKSQDMQALVQAERERLCRVPFEQMEDRVREFCGRILASRCSSPTSKA